MNVRIQWAVGTAILVTVCVLPLLLWSDDFDHSLWVATLLPTTVVVLSLLALLVKRACEACENTLRLTSSTDSEKLEEIPEEVFCPACSYNLQGAPGTKCPECGYSLDGIRSRACQIPWTWPRDIGRVRGYWSTVWLVTFRNRRFCEEYAHPVSYPAAQTFRWATVLHAYLPALALIVVVYLTATPESPVPPSFQQWMAAGFVQSNRSVFDRAYAEVWPVAVVYVAYLLFLATATGVASYFFHPREVSAQRQNAAIAMSHYTCGPLALTILPVMILWAVFAHGRLDCWHSQAGLLFAGLTAFSLVAAWWFNLIRLARRTMPQLRSRTLWLAVSLPCLWLAIAGLILVGLPLAFLAVAVVVASF